MPAAFTSEERDKILAAMLGDARGRIPDVGLKKLSIESLTDGAGISKGAFYAFFDSKEALYAELLAQEAPGLAARVLAPLDEPSLAPRTAFGRFLRGLMDEYDENPLLRRLIEHPDELAAVRQRLGPDRLAAKAKLGVEPLHAFLRRARESGDLVRDDLQAVLGIVAALPHLLLHKSAIGGDGWPATRDLLIDLIVTGLFKCPPEPGKDA